MAAEIIDGKEISTAILQRLTKEVSALTVEGVTPRLAVILLGDDPASKSYVRAKQRAAMEAGIEVEIHRGSGDDDPVAITAEIKVLAERLNADSTVHGIILQLPVPEGVDEQLILNTIAPVKDVDGLHPANQSLLIQGRARYYPATPHGIQQLLIRSGNDPGGRSVVIVGRSLLIGVPLALMLLQKREGANATVTVCHTATRDLRKFTQQADILVAAAGRPGLITADMVQPNAVVIDAGITRVEDPTRKTGYRLLGDVDFEAVRERAAFITPVPGGVGPMTVTMLLTNVARAARLSVRG